MRAILASLLLAAPAASATPRTIDLGGRIDASFIGVSEKGRAIWVQAFRRAEELLKKLERLINGDLEEHERQCFLQEALKLFVPEAKDGIKITGAPQGDVTPEFMRHVLEKLDQVNRCSPTNRGYLALHSWKATGFQEPRQLPDGQKMTLADFLQGLAGVGIGVGSASPTAVPSAGAPVIIINPELFMRPVPDKT